MTAHITSVRFDGYKWYWACSAGDVTSLMNAYDSRDEAKAAAEEHEVNARG